MDSPQLFGELAIYAYPSGSSDILLRPGPEQGGLVRADSATMWEQEVMRVPRPWRAE